MPTILVRVKPDMRGEYGVAGSEPDPTHKTGVAGYTNIIRNAGEVFEMDVRACKPEGATGTGLCELVEVKVGKETKKFRLPSWVESVKEKPKHVDPDALVPSGHQTRFDKNTTVI